MCCNFLGCNIFVQMWFSSHRLNNFKADVYGTKMLIYLSTKWVTMYFGNTDSVCLKDVCSL